MRLKKILAGALALSMFITPCISMAADPTEATEAPADGSVAGDGELEGFVKQEAFRVILPTTIKTDVDFNLDPQGLLHKTDDTNYTKDTTGWILFGEEKLKNQSKSIFTTNKSSYPVQVDVKLNVTNMNTEDARVSFVDTAANVTGSEEDGTDKSLNMYIAAAPKKDKEKADGSGDVSTVRIPVALAEKNADGTTDNNTGRGEANFSFVLNGYADNYKISKNSVSNEYEYVLREASDSPALDDTQWDTAGFVLEGNVNQNADWTTFLEKQTDITNAEKLKIEVSYKIDKYSGEYADATLDSEAHGLVKKVEVEESKNVLESDGTNDIVIEFVTEPTKITLIPKEITGSSKTPVPTTKGTHWTVEEDGCLHLKPALINALTSSSSRGTGTYAITVDETEYILTFTK